MTSCGSARGNKSAKKSPKSVSGFGRVRVSLSLHEILFDDGKPYYSSVKVGWIAK